MADRNSLPALPITEHLSKIVAGIQSNQITLLQAPPGSGKTTLLPLSLINEPWLKQKKIVMLQPRRLAAKTVASRMAELLGDSVGGTVGYQIRLEQRVTAQTRIEVITEGLLTRRLVSEPELADIGVLIFDEFHERSIHADVGLALAREVATTLRSDLRLVVMSATMQGLMQSESFSDAWHYAFDVPPYPVAIHHVTPEPRRAIFEQTGRIIRQALQNHPGDLLAFLPGVSEIERCRTILLDTLKNVEVVPLYGELSYDQQRIALAPPSAGKRKVVLSTPIAETSLTIDGVRIVVDSGFHKVARSSTTGAQLLSTERITLDSADQRAGRAGRTAPGVCLRLWSDAEHRTLRPSREPEVLRVDLAQPLLELAAWGIRDPHTFSWITKPSEAAIRDALGTLRTLDAIDATGRITHRGNIMVSLGTHPRIANLCLESRRYGLEGYASVLIPLLEERLPERLTAHSVDISRIAEPLGTKGALKSLPTRIGDLSKLWLNRIQRLPGAKKPSDAVEAISSPFGFLIATAFPERIAKRRGLGQERYLLASGRGARLMPSDPLIEHEYIAAANLLERGEDSVISLAAPLDQGLFDKSLQHLVGTSSRVEFDEEKGQLRAFARTSIGAVIIKEEPVRSITDEDRRAALRSYLQTTEGIVRIPWTENLRDLQARAQWARTNSNGTLPDISDPALQLSEPFWLESVLPANGKLSSLTSQNIEQSLRDQFSWAQWQDLQSIAPESYTLPSGKVRKLSYSVEEGPALEALIQELFGLNSTPTIGRYRAPVTLRLLSPARRPMQVTRDLESFWRNSYPEIRKELRGRYPKHRWPEDPTKSE